VDPLAGNEQSFGDFLSRVSSRSHDSDHLILLSLHDAQAGLAALPRLEPPLSTDFDLESTNGQLEL
jgi:hypothetical protein